MKLDKYRKYQNLTWSAIHINNLRTIKKTRVNLKMSAYIESPFYYRLNRHISLKPFRNRIGTRKLHRRTRENISIGYGKYRKISIFITRNNYERIREQ